MLQILNVDGNEIATAALLRYLQLEILSGDDPQESSTGHWWIAYDNALPVGFASMLQSSRWSDAGYLSRSGVLTTHRGQGLQKRLLRAREKKARSLKWKWLISDTYQNPASANSLIACGYKIFIPSKPWGFDGAIYWRKGLSL